MRLQDRNVGSPRRLKSAATASTPVTCRCRRRCDRDVARRVSPLDSGNDRTADRSESRLKDRRIVVGADAKNLSTTADDRQRRL
jgi:hypothetical protein